MSTICMPIWRRLVLFPGAQLGQRIRIRIRRCRPSQDSAMGRVIVRDKVEMAPATTVDRRALGDTVIGEGTKIDNLVQIGHNTRTGRQLRRAGHPDALVTIRAWRQGASRITPANWRCGRIRCKRRVREPGSGARVTRRAGATDEGWPAGVARLACWPNATSGIGWLKTNFDGVFLDVSNQKAAADRAPLFPGKACRNKLGESAGRIKGVRSQEPIFLGHFPDFAVSARPHRGSDGATAGAWSCVRLGEARGTPWSIS